MLNKAREVLDIIHIYHMSCVAIIAWRGYRLYIANGVAIVKSVYWGRTRAIIEHEARRLIILVLEL
jgi:hypothetical protein